LTVVTTIGIVFVVTRKYLASGSYDQSIRLWNVDSLECDLVFAWSSDDHILILGSRDKTIRVWSIADGQCMKVLTSTFK
jgi:predicted NACHT family NTPase